MVEESVEHAFEDMAARRWIETKLRAQETVAATRKGLAECPAELDAGDKAKIEAALQAVEELLAAEKSETQGGDVPGLKAALSALDEATQPLADLMMDRAIEAMLRKRGLLQ